MRKGQIKLLEKAEKEGFTEEQLAVLRGNQMLYTLDYYYFLLKRGVSASVINAIIKAGEGWGNAFVWIPVDGMWLFIGGYPYIY